MSKQTTSSQAALNNLSKGTQLTDSMNTRTGVPDEISAAKQAQVLQLQPANGKAIFADFRPYKVAKGEEYMSAGQIEYFTLVLATWKRKLMEEAAHTANELSQDTTDMADESDRATSEEQFAIKLRTRDRENKLIQKINDALFRIKNDDFGWCNSCGGEIGVPRLGARPTAELCINCKNLEELRERQGTATSD